nr:unnamed protein product [Digitaria exilis]
MRSHRLLTFTSVASERLRALELVGCLAVCELQVAASALDSPVVGAPHVDSPRQEHYHDLVDLPWSPRLQRAAAVPAPLPRWSIRHVVGRFTARRTPQLDSARHEHITLTQPR